MNIDYEIGQSLYTYMFNVVNDRLSMPHDRLPYLNSIEILELKIKQVVVEEKSIKIKLYNKKHSIWLEINNSSAFFFNDREKAVEAAYKEFSDCYLKALSEKEDEDA